MIIFRLVHRLSIAISIRSRALYSVQMYKDTGIDTIQILERFFLDFVLMAKEVIYEMIRQI